MEKSLLQRKAEYVCDFVNHFEYIDKVTDLFHFPNINYKQVSEILTSPDTESELKFANQVLELSKIIEENDNIINGISYFNPANNDGYDYFEYGITLVLEEILDLKSKININTADGKIDFMQQLNGVVVGVAEDARNQSVEKYLQLCCDVNMYNIPKYTEALLNSLCEGDVTKKFLTSDNTPLSIRLMVVANMAYLTQALYIGDRLNIEGTKRTVTEEDLELASKFMDKFTEYVKSLNSFTRK